MRTTDKDDLKQVLIDAIKQAFSETSVEDTSASGNSQPPSASRLTQPLTEAIQTTLSSDAATGSSKSRSASVKEDQECQLKAPPNSPLPASSEPVTLVQLKDLFEAVLEKKSNSTSGPVAGPTGPEQTTEKNKDKDTDTNRVCASRLDYKTVDEVYAILI